ncbi:MAG TPA: winged helix-turn-helix domain-containing protein [Nitrososphaeraceae archaeon]|nr:winged helix-turn-helix domain-containing protein [Nitrososphaeraceae archaeon]
MMIAERKNTRGRIEIIASILFHCREGIKKTHIMSKANVGYEQLCYYLPNLINTGLLAQQIEDGCVVYRTTESGRQFLKSYFEIMTLLAGKKYNDKSQLVTCDIDSGISHDYENGTNKPLISIFEEEGI